MYIYLFIYIYNNLYISIINICFIIMNTNNYKFRGSSTKSNITCNISDISCWIYCTCLNEVYILYIYKYYKYKFYNN